MYARHRGRKTKKKTSTMTFHLYRELPCPVGRISHQIHTRLEKHALRGALTPAQTSHCVAPHHAVLLNKVPHLHNCLVHRLCHIAQCLYKRHLHHSTTLSSITPHPSATFYSHEQTHLATLSSSWKNLRNTLCFFFFAVMARNAASVNPPATTSVAQTHKNPVGRNNNGDTSDATVAAATHMQPNR